MDFFQSLNSLKPISVLVSPENKTVDIAAITDAYNPDKEIVDLGDVDDLKIEPMERFIYGTVKTGPPDQNYNLSNGRYEFNTETEWATDNLVDEQLNLVGKYRTDSIGFSLLRYEVEKKSTSDTKSDNSVFMVVCAPHRGQGVAQTRDGSNHRGRYNPDPT